MHIRTERNYNSVYLLGRKLINSMQNCKSIVPMVYEWYQLLHCIGMACIIMSSDNVGFTRSKRVK